MAYDLKVSLENIIPLTYARDHFSNIVNEVQSDKMYILTKGGKPAIALIDVKYLEQLTGGQIQKAQIKQEINKNPEQVGLPKMIGHTPSMPAPQAPLPPKPSFSSLKFKPTPPPPLSSNNPPPPRPPMSPAPEPKPVFIRKPEPPFQPPKPAEPVAPVTPPKPVMPPPPVTPPPPPPISPPRPEPKPIEPPPVPSAPGSLILPSDEIKKPDSPSDDNAKIEVEFSTDSADLDTSATQSDNSEPKKSADEVEEMEIG